MRGADINAATTLKGHTAIHIAAHRGFSQVVSALIRAGANLDLLDKEGRTAAALTTNPRILHELQAASSLIGMCNNHTE